MDNNKTNNTETAITDDQIKTVQTYLENKYPGHEVKAFKFKTWIVGLRSATALEYSRWFSGITPVRGKSNSYEASRRLASDCFVYPESSDGKPDHLIFKKIIDRYSSMVIKFANRVQELSGEGEGDEDEDQGNG